MAAGATGAPRIERRLATLRGRLAVSRALEDVQAGLAAGASLAALLGLLAFLGLLPVSGAAAAKSALCVALAVPAAGVLVRRTSARRVALLVDERLGLAERVATALSLETGESSPTPLAPLVAEDALASLDNAPASALREAFRPRFLRRPSEVAVGAAFLAVALFQQDPLQREKEKPKDIAAAYRDQKEREEAAKAARRVREEAKSIEENADPKHAALRAVAAEVRRQAEEMLRQTPPKAEAMGKLQKMGEMVRERAELLAGVDPAKLKEWKEEGRLTKPDPALEKLLGKLLGADLKGLNEQLRSLDAALKGKEGAPEFSAEMLASLRERLEKLADEMAKNPGAFQGREGLQKNLQVIGNPELLREIAERLARLQEKMRKEGAESARDPKGLNDGSLEDFEAGEPVYLTDMQLQAMIDRLKELEAMEELGGT